MGGHSQSCDGRLSARRPEEMGPKAEKARRLLVSCWLKNSSSLPASLIRSGVVEREIIRWNWSQPRDPFTNRLAALQARQMIFFFILVSRCGVLCEEGEN